MKKITRRSFTTSLLFGTALGSHALAQDAQQSADEEDIPILVRRNVSAFRARSNWQDYFSNLK